MVDMVETSSIQGLQRLERIITLDEIAQEIKTEIPKVYSKDLIEVIFRLPYTKRQFLIDAGLGTPKTLGNYLIELEEKGFIKSVKVGKEKIYLNYKLMEILESE